MTLSKNNSLAVGLTIFYLWEINIMPPHKDGGPSPVEKSHCSGNVCRETLKSSSETLRYASDGSISLIIL